MKHHLSFCAHASAWNSQESCSGTPQGYCNQISVLQKLKIITTGAICMASFFMATSLSAAEKLEVDPTPIVWNTIGLDHNNVYVGPQSYPVGVRINNTGSDPATNVSATIDFVPGSPHLTLSDGKTVSVPSIAAGGHADFFYNVRVTPDEGAIGSTQKYKISVTSTGHSTPVVAENELLIEPISSSDDTGIVSLAGPLHVETGGVYDFAINARTTADSAGVQTFLDLPNSNFQIVNVLSAASDVHSDRLILDAAGTDIVTTITALVVKAPDGALTVRAGILSKSANGISSNLDYAQNGLTIGAAPLVETRTGGGWGQPELTLVKSAVQNPVEAGDNATFLLTVINSGNGTAEDVRLKDYLPSGLAYVSASPSPYYVGSPILWKLGDIYKNSQKTVTLVTKTKCSALGDQKNKATVEEDRDYHIQTTGGTYPEVYTAYYTVKVQDSKKPVIKCPTDISVDAEYGKCKKQVYFTVTATDNCSQNVTIVSDPPSGTYFNVGTTVVTSTATDSAGNKATCTFKVTVRDTKEPSISCPPNIKVNSDEYKCSKVVAITPPTATDDCGQPTVQGTRSDGKPLTDPYPVGITTITWEAKDASGNKKICKQTIEVCDVIKPRIQCPDNKVVNAEAGKCRSGAVSYTATATDNCTAQPTVTLDPPSGSTFPVGEHTVTATATDAFGNKATCTFKVKVVGNQGPGITCPPAIDITADQGKCYATNCNIIPPVGTAGCGGQPVTVTGVRSDGKPLTDPYPVGTTVITWTASSGSQSVSCEQLVKVSDNAAPEITCKANIQVNATDKYCYAKNVVIVPPTATDKCTSGPVTVTGVRSDGKPLTDPYPVGTTTITWTATDASGLKATCTQKVIVKDKIPPTIDCCDDIIVYADRDSCTCTTVNVVPPEAKDNCSVANVVGMRSDMLPLTAPYPIGVTTITWTVTDASGLQATCIQKVIVKDNSKPKINCHENINVNTDYGKCGAKVTYNVTATSGCGNTPVNVVCTPPSGSFFPVGNTVVNCVAKDNDGNETRCSFTVCVTDNEKPKINCCADITTCDKNVQLDPPTTSDNCGVATVVGTRSDGKPLTAPFPLGTTVISWKVTDIHGNVSTCYQKVMISGSGKPEILCPADYTIPAVTQNCKSAPVDYPEPTVLDNCSSDTSQLIITYNPPEGTALPMGTTVVTVTVTNPNNQSATCTFKVTVVDNTKPTLNCPGNITVANTPGKCGNDSVTYQASATDTCSGPVDVVLNPPSGSAFPAGTSLVLVTATDKAGNVATCKFTVTVTDTQPPKITCPPSITVTADAEQCQAVIASLGQPATSDNCATQTLSGIRSDNKMLTEPYPVGTTTITWSITDTSGNLAQCNQMVTVRDSVQPTIQCPPNMSVGTLAGQCASGPVHYANAVVSDNCTSPENLIVTFNPPSGSTFPLGVHTVTATVKDAGGNQATCTFTVTVRDLTGPVITCPANIVTSSTPGICGKQNVTFAVTATDACSNPVTVQTSVPSGATFPLGTTTVNATATDSAGNTSTCSFTVTVTDGEAPALDCPDPLVVPTSPGECEALGVEYSANAPDNCNGPVTIQFTPPSGSDLPIGVNTILVKATDGGGNVAECSFTVTVVDREAPRILCQSDITTATIPCELEAVVLLTPPEVLDTCGEATVAGVRSDGRPLTDRFPVGPTTVVWTAVDANNNQSSCSQLIQINESQCVPVCDGPDLVIMAKMLPQYKCSSAPNCKWKGWYVITNVGNQTSAETTVCFYMSEDGIFNTGDFKFKQLRKYRVKSLAPGEMVAVDGKGKGPKGTPMEGKYIIAVVDCGNLVNECREDNNEAPDIGMPKPKKK